MGGVATEVFLPIALGVIMLGLGLSLTPADFRRVVVYPKAVVIGLTCQVVLLPAICFGLTKAFGLPPELAVGMMVLAASPGGATANLYSHLAKGDVALNITLTAVNSLLSVVTLPLMIEFAMQQFLAKDQQIPLQFGKVLTVVSIILVPAALGMLVRAKNSAFADKAERPVKVASLVFLVLVIAASIIKERANLGDYLRQAGAAAVTFNLVSLVVGYYVPLLLKIPHRQAIAIGMEIGIHNGTLAIAVATTLLGSSVFAIPAAIYSLLGFLTAAVFGVVVGRRAVAESGASAPPAAPA